MTTDAKPRIGPIFGALMLVLLIASLDPTENLEVVRHLPASLAERPLDPVPA